MAADRRRGIWSRRDFLTRVGWAGFGFFSLAALLGFIRSAFPRILFQPPSILKVGLPSDYALGEVSEKYKQDYRVWIIREDEGIYALFAKCTHLGCTPRWLAAEDKFMSVPRQWLLQERYEFRRTGAAAIRSLSNLSR
jgi:cytochrome b6-f complex iron-sulfur subunit